MKVDLLNTLLQMNVIASLSIVFILCSRLLFRRFFGARAAYRLWGVLPVAMIAVLLPARQIVEIVKAPANPVEAVFTGTETKNPAGGLAQGGGSVIDTAPAEIVIGQSDLLANIPALLLLVWLFGAVASVALLCWRQKRYVESLGELQRDNIGGVTVWRSARSGIGPALLGVFRLRLIIPSDFENRFTKSERKLILLHERAHISAGDAQLNFCIAAATCAFWFNPLIYVAARMIRKDQELACDAAVVNDRPVSRRLYADALLKSRMLDAAMPVGCAWPSSSKGMLATRIAALKSMQRAMRRNKAGLIIVLGLGVAGGAAAWASQPPIKITLFGSETFAVTAVDLKSIAANLTVIPEDRADVVLSMEPNALFPTPNLRIESQRLVIDGGLELETAACAESFDGRGTVNIPGIGALRRNDLPKITLRTPRKVDLTTHGVVLSDIGRSAGGRIETNSCAKTYVDRASGPLSIYLLSVGNVEAERIRAPLYAGLFGKGDLLLDGGKSATFDLHNSGDVNAGDFSGAVTANLKASGSLLLGRIGGAADFEISGGGNIEVDHLSTRNAEMLVAGAGSIRIKRGAIDNLSATLSGTGDIRFDGDAEFVDANFEAGEGDLFVAKAGYVTTQQDEGATGEVKVGG